MSAALVNGSGQEVKESTICVCCDSLKAFHIAWTFIASNALSATRAFMEDSPHAFEKIVFASVPEVLQCFSEMAEMHFPRNDATLKGSKTVARVDKKSRTTSNAVRPS